MLLTFAFRSHLTYRSWTSGPRRDHRRKQAGIRPTGWRVSTGEDPEHLTLISSGLTPWHFQSSMDAASTSPNYIHCSITMQERAAPTPDRLSRSNGAGLPLTDSWGSWRLTRARIGPFHR